MITLIVRGRDGRQSVVALGDRVLTIGRAESCDIVLRNDAEVSREHARVCLDEQGRILVTDTNSKNGTRVDRSDPFRNQTRAVRESIEIGEHVITVRGAPRVSEATQASVTFTSDAMEVSGSTRFYPSTKGLDLSHQRLGLLMSLTDRIGGAFERKQLLEQAVDACCEALQFERGLIVLKTPRGEPESPVARNVDRDETGAYKVSRTLINRALIHGERAIVNNPATDLVGNISESLVRFPIRSALCVPILHRDEILGVVYGDRITQAASYSSEDVDFLAAIAQQVGVGLANLRLLREYVNAQTMYAALEAARSIQRDLLPAAPLQRGRVRIDGYNEPSTAVGGDYFDYFPLAEISGPEAGDKIGFVIADVTGHGLPAALMMANFQGAVHSALTGHAPLPDLAARVNRLVYRNTGPGVFITAVIGTIDAGTGVIEYISAGHQAPLFVGCTEQSPSDDDNALPFGVEPTDEYRVCRIEPDQHAGTVLFYTDGLSECPDPEGVLLGTDALRKHLARTEASTEATLHTMLELVRQCLAGQNNPDDLTLLALQVRDA